MFKGFYFQNKRGSMFSKEIDFNPHLISIVSKGIDFEGTSSILYTNNCFSKETYVNAHLLSTRYQGIDFNARILYYFFEEIDFQTTCFLYVPTELISTHIIFLYRPQEVILKAHPLSTCSKGIDFNVHFPSRFFIFHRN